MKINTDVKPTHHFWYSPKYEKLTRNPYGNTSRKNSNVFALIDGKKVYYSFSSQTKENHGYGWDDMQYLGHGTIIYE